MDFFPKPQNRHAGRSRAPYEPCSAKFGDPRGVQNPPTLKKNWGGAKKGIPIKAALADRKKVVKTGSIFMSRGRVIGRGSAESRLRGMGRGSVGGMVEGHGQGQCWRRI